MFTRCPACQTLFRVHAETLRIAQGQVRCGRCAAQFNALDSLTDAPETLAGAAGGAEAAQASPAETLTAATAGGVAEASPPEAAVLEDSSEDLSAGEVPESPPKAVPLSLASEVIQEALLTEERAPRPFGPRLAGAAAILVLLALLGGQWVYLQRAALFEWPTLRPLLHRYCAALACQLPLPQQPERFEVVERIVREHPRVPRALLVDITFVSRAGEPVAYPQLEMRLSDVSGNRVAGRRFLPVEYLASGTDIAAGVPPDEHVAVTLELIEPAIDAVSFEFEFH